MLSDSDISTQLPFVLAETHFDFLGERYEGKVRDTYRRGDERILITTDRLSCFDRVVTSVPFKGQVLNELAIHWFKLTEHIVRNHILDVPDPNVMRVRNCAILPVEVVVRGYLAGSAWRDYAAGRPVSGVSFPPGLRFGDRLPEPTLTPSTKAPRGEHDEPVSEAEIVARGIVDRRLWDEVRETALSLFALGQAESAQRGLALVDTKYEFGLVEGRLVLADEIHTLDSSRYWVEATLHERLARGEDPEMLDKEPTRQWLLKQGFKGDGPIPVFTPEHRSAIARHYIDCFERITGLAFVGKTGPVLPRIEAALRSLVG
jgi:phosphoribosylaminoimidazole-succinocarboxamide synthase